MEIILNTSTEKIKADLTKELKEIFGDSIPKDQVDIVKKCIDQRIKRKSSDFYKSYDSMENVMNAVSKQLIEQKADSKIEAIFYGLLLETKIPFKFQYKIAPYRVDFLIAEFLVFEIDGPVHLLKQDYDERRTKHIKRMGYKIMRVPVGILAMAPEIIIKEIKHRLNLMGLNYEK